MSEEANALGRLASFHARRRTALETAVSEPPNTPSATPEPQLRTPDVPVAGRGNPTTVDSETFGNVGPLMPMPHTAVPDIRNQRCAFCGSPQAWFGYSPPLVRVPFWTCRKHRPNAEACALAGTSPQPLKPPQGDRQHG
jgi:hypothetical protein